VSLHRFLIIDIVWKGGVLNRDHHLLAVVLVDLKGPKD